MKRSSMEFVDIVYRDLKAANLPITGGVFKYERPGGSALEDIVVNGLEALSLPVMQYCVVNVNIHVPMLKETSNSLTYDTPNTARLKALSALVVDTLEDKWGSDYNYDVQSANLVKDFDGKYFQNIRIEFNSINV